MLLLVNGEKERWTLSIKMWKILTITRCNLVWSWICKLDNIIAFNYSFIAINWNELINKNENVTHSLEEWTTLYLILSINDFYVLKMYNFLLNVSLFIYANSLCLLLQLRIVFLLNIVLYEFDNSNVQSITSLLLPKMQKFETFWKYRDSPTYIEVKLFVDFGQILILQNKSDQILV